MKSEQSKQQNSENIWTDECEKLLAEWSEKASCYRWLHGRCEKSYRTWYYCFSIPVIILSTLTGAANVGMDSFVPTESKAIASAIVGGVNIFAGIISTLQNFLKVAELMEGHRIAGISWGKLQRNISIELALDESRRVLQTDFLKLARAEYDRLIEAGPIIDDKIILNFNKKFKNYEVSVPSICNGLDKCSVYKIDKTIEMNNEEFKDGIEDIVSKEEKTPIISEPFNVKIEKNINMDNNNTENNIEDIEDIEDIIPNKETNNKETNNKETNNKETNNKETNTENINLIIKEEDDLLPKIKKKKKIKKKVVEENKVEENKVEENKVEENKVEENK